MLHLFLHSICPLAYSLFSSPHRFLLHTPRPQIQLPTYFFPRLYPLMNPARGRRDKTGRKKPKRNKASRFKREEEGKDAKMWSLVSAVRPRENPWVNEFIFRKGSPAIRVTSQVADLQHGSKPVTGSRNETLLALAVLMSRRIRSVGISRRFYLLEILRQTGRGSRRWRTASRRRGMV